MYNLAATSKQSMLDLINNENNTKFTLSQVSLGLPSESMGAHFPSKLSTTNTVVELIDANDPSQLVVIGYHRIPGNDAFGTEPTIPMVVEGKSDADIIGTALDHIRTVWGMPLEVGTFSATRPGQTVVVSLNGHYVLDDGDITIKVSELASLKTLLSTLVATDHFAAGDSFTGDTSAAVLLALINGENGTALTLGDVVLSKPRSVSGTTPGDAVTLTGVASAGYGEGVDFSYSRLNIEDLSPQGVTLGSFSTYNDFYDAVTPDYLATHLTQLWGFPVLASELRVRNQADGGDTFTARVTILDNYIARSTGGITVTSAKTAG